MRNVSSLAVTLAWSLLACGSENAIPEGEPIPGTSIVSCGEALANSELAPPTGGLSDISLTVGATTVLEGAVIWQAPCPNAPNGEATEFVLDKVSLYENDAGFPGDAIGSTEFLISGVVTCPNPSGKQDIAPLEVVDLGPLCTEHTAMPSTSALAVQVEATGHATTCSADESELLFRSKVGVDCPAP